MTYWLCITDVGNWEIIKEKNIWGVSKRHANKLMSTKIGDKLVFYVKQKPPSDPPTIRGIFKVVSKPFYDEKPIFKAPSLPFLQDPQEIGETYPWRVKIAPIKTGYLEFKPLIKQLKFITNKTSRGWGGHLMGKAMREIPEEDFKLIESLL